MMTLTRRGFFALLAAGAAARAIPAPAPAIAEVTRVARRLGEVTFVGGRRGGGKTMMRPLIDPEELAAYHAAVIAECRAQLAKG